MLISPGLNGRLDSIVPRVPVPDGAVVDLFPESQNGTSIGEVNQSIMSASEMNQYKGILEYLEKPIILTDIIGNPSSSIYDSGYTNLVSGKYLRTLNWYDNEWGYSNRVVDLINLLKF